MTENLMDDFFKPKKEGPCINCGKITKRKSHGGMFGPFGTAFICTKCHKKHS